jgi:hypothetical protein
MNENPSMQRVMDGSSWSEFCDTIRMAQQVILSGTAPGDPLTRVEGFRYLSRITRSALEAFVEYADPLAPVLFRPVHETVKMGADNPDNYYQWATISGRHDYRLRGSRGTIAYLGIGTYAGQYGSGQRTAETGYIEARDLALEPDGSFEIILSCEPKAGNWLRMEPDTGSLIVRQTFLDRQRERIADLRIERIGGAPGPSPLTPERIDEGLGMAGRLVMGAAMLFAGWAEGFSKRPNELPLFDPTTSLAAFGDPNITYYHGYWKLAPDEALVVEAVPPACDYWNFQLCNHWMESLDYRHHRIAINKHEARCREDGSVRIVVAHRDPGVENWIETAGHDRGTMCLRWVRAATKPQPRTRVVDFSEIQR